MSKEIGFSYGVIEDSLEVQANTLGYTLGKDADKYEKIRNAINMCGFHVATESQVNLMFNKLQQKVVGSLKLIG
jgi:hypothetical protein